MRVVGLISGGKDSIWNLHYCRQFGHTIECLAHLAPPTDVDELDSYLYQTVGSNLVGAIAEALDLPLVLREIQGTSKCTQTLTYGITDGDEVEDLFFLLQAVKREFPGVDAVSCGAILSDYQRLRVEHVCARLGLKVLAFMWRQRQEMLLQQMIDAGLDARIVKVACMGLKAQHVGATILDPEFSSYIFSLGQKWGVHVCGEGGEYESSVVDAPMYLRRVLMHGCEKIVHSRDEMAPVVFLKSRSSSTQSKEEGAKEPPYAALADYTSLQYYASDFPFEDLSDQRGAVVKMCPRPAGEAGLQAPLQASPLVCPSWSSGGLWASPSFDVASLGLKCQGDAAHQCEMVFHSVKLWLDCHNLRFELLAFVELQVDDLSTFDALNDSYRSFFGSNPPARVCIQTSLPRGVCFRIRLLGCAPAPLDLLECLHVQSISTWAMACIGPYSQATRVGRWVFTSGVIGLVPHSMTLPSQGALVAAGLSSSTPNWSVELWLLLRSLHNVLQVMRCTWDHVIIAQVFTSLPGSCQAVRGALGLWMQRLSVHTGHIIAVAEVSRLPRDAKVETNLILHEGDKTPFLWTHTLLVGQAQVHLEVLEADNAMCIIVVIESHDYSTEAWQPALAHAAGDLVHEIGRREMKWLSLQVKYLPFVREADVGMQIQQLLSAALNENPPLVSFMPVTGLAGETLLQLTALATVDS